MDDNHKNKYDEISKLIILKNYKENINNHLNKKISMKTLKKLFIFFQDNIGDDLNKYINFNDTKQVDILREKLYKISYILSLLIHDVNNNKFDIKELKSVFSKLGVNFSNEDYSKILNLLISKKKHLAKMHYNYYKKKYNIKFPGQKTEFGTIIELQDGGKYCFDETSGKSFLIINILDFIATLIGLVPGIGIFADVASIFLSAATCDYIGAVISLINAIPVAGMFTGIIKALKKMVNIYEGFQIVRNPEAYFKKKTLPKGYQKWASRRDQFNQGMQLVQAARQQNTSRQSQYQYPQPNNKSKPYAVYYNQKT